MGPKAKELLLTGADGAWLHKARRYRCLERQCDHRPASLDSALGGNLFRAFASSEISLLRGLLGGQVTLERPKSRFRSEEIQTVSRTFLLLSVTESGTGTDLRES